MMKVDRTKQLYIERKGLIVTFKDKGSGNRHHVQVSHLRALIFGGLKYIYANEYIPLPKGTNRFNFKERTEAIKNKIKVPLINKL